MIHMRVRVVYATKRKRRLCRTPLGKIDRPTMLTSVDDVDCPSCLDRIAWMVERVLREAGHALPE